MTRLALTVGSLLGIGSMLVSATPIVLETSNAAAAPMCVATHLSVGRLPGMWQGQGMPKVAEDVAGQEKKLNEAERDSSVNKPGEGLKRPGGVRTRMSPRALPLEVTITTDVPEAQVFLNLGGGRTQKLGTTDAQGNLTTTLARGRHLLTASRAGHRIQNQQIDVRPGSTNFSFTLALPEKLAKAETPVEKEPEVTPPVEPVAAQPPDQPAVNSEDIIMRYLDVKESDSVSANDWETVQTQTSATLVKEPDNTQLKARALLAQGQLAYLKRDYAGALIAFRKALLTQPDFVAAHYALGNAYLATNQPVQALSAYQSAARLNPQLALAQKGLGDTLTKQGKSKEAEKYYKRAQDLGIGQPATTPSVVPSTLTTAMNLIKRKRWTEALKELTEISKTAPTSAVFIHMGDCYLELKQPLSAMQSYRKAMELDSRSALAAYRYGELMYESREYAAAMEALESALALDLTGSSFDRKRARSMADKAAEKVRKMQ